MSLATFTRDALAQGSVSKYGGRNTWKDGGFLGECVSLINQYLKREYGITAGAWGDAKDWATSPQVARYFDKVSAPTPGDILVYGAVPGNPYGHIAIYLGDNTMLDQNGTVARRVAKGRMWSNPIAILRRKGDNVAKPTYEEVLRHFRTFQGSDPTEKQMNYYVANDWGVLNGDLLVLNHDRLINANKKIKALEADKNKDFEKLDFEVFKRKKV